MPRRNRQRDIEGGHEGDDRRDPPNQPSQGESNSGDSSGPFFSMYCKAADVEDKKKVEQWQNDAEGILIFTGLFSAAVAQLLSITVPDLRPNSQDTSAFYLGEIYGILADPNATRTSIPSPIAQPTPFTPPTFAVWVNSLWFLSLVIALTCALLATSLHQWSRRYLMVTQPAWCSPEKRARMRAYFAEGVDNMHIPLAVEALPMLLHLSVFLFLGGLVIFLFNVNHKVFGSVMWWTGLFSMAYVLITVMPIVRHNSPYYAPLSQPAWFLYARMNHVVFKFLASKSLRSGALESWRRFSKLMDRYHGWMSGGVEKAAEEMVSERSSEIDIRIFDWTIRVLGDDDSLEKFFEALPGLSSSKLVNHFEGDFPSAILERFWSALKSFMDRTLSSNSVVESVKTRRIIICRDIVSSTLGSRCDTLSDLFNQAPASDERLVRLQAMAQWRFHILESILDALGEDGARETFLEAIPRIFDSNLFNRLKEHLPDDFRSKFSEALSGFLDCTVSFRSVTESVRSNRLVICLSAARAALGVDGVSRILQNILNGRWPELIQSVEMDRLSSCR
ncbi:hypothetical protein BJV77DRAFT_699077 [Russula vinacea]|nr:hypothetical protein BJV77DRAFT_699077 [Russula vinacea]